MILRGGSEPQTKIFFKTQTNKHSASFLKIFFLLLFICIWGKLDETYGTYVLSPPPPHHKCRDSGGNFSKATCGQTQWLEWARARAFFTYGVSEKRARCL